MIEHIRFFAETIGPRPTGSEAEAEALAYCERHFQGHGFHLSRFPVTEIKPHQRSVLLFFSIMTSFVVSMLLFEALPWLVLVMFLLMRFVVIPRRIQARQRPYPGGLTAFNVIAEQPAPDPKATVIIGAHLDTALASTFHKTGWRAWARRLFNFGHMSKAFLILVALFALQFIIGSHPLFTPLRVILKAYIVATYLLMVYRLWENSREERHFAPGANDNASGVAAVLGLADHFAAHPPQHLNLRYMVFCAEEVGLVGSERYVQSLSDLSHLYMFNFDMVGSGDKLKVIPTKHDKRINDWFKETGAKVGRYAFGSSDFRGFAKRKIPAVGLFTAGDKMIFQVYHTTEDVMTYINQPILDKTRDAAVQVIERLDAEPLPLGMTTA